MNIDRERQDFLKYYVGVNTSAYSDVDTGFKRGEFTDPVVQRGFGIWLAAKGSVTTDPFYTCSTCFGSGYITNDLSSVHSTTCEKCGGAGRVNS